MGKTYINGMGCISAQKTFDTVFLNDAAVNDSANVLPIVAPVYKDFISPTAIRRMAKGVKNGIVASALAMKEAGLAKPDAVITGTGLGCVEDSDKFLKAIIDNNEEFLTPTSFIQSTHNTVGAQIALNMQCKGYNFTYVHGAVSFESALLDAKMKIDEQEASAVLVGGVDEMNDYTIKVFKLAGFIKEDNAPPYIVLNSRTNGAVFGEGSTFFVVEDKIKESTYAEVVDVDIVNRLNIEEVAGKAHAFLKANNMQAEDIDAVVLGYNGDAEFDRYYTVLAGMFEQTQQVYYKHLCGEYNTASAFGLWVGAHIINHDEVPAILRINDAAQRPYNNILLYNQYRGIDHSFTLISTCRSTR